jgi:hypothetical protein
MELVSRLAREPWTDRPACVHPVLSAVARAAHDHSTSAGRRQLLPLAPHFLNTSRAGFEQSARLVALCVSTALAAGDLLSDERRRLAAAHRTALHLLGANDSTNNGVHDGTKDGTRDGPGGAARWWLPALGRLGWSEPFYRTFVATEQAAEAVAVTARAANGDRDVRLRQLVKQCLNAHGALRPGAPTPS